MIYILIILGTFCIDYNVKKYVNNHRLQGNSEEYADGKLILRNCHNPSGMLGIFKGREHLGEIFSGAVLLCVIWDFIKAVATKGGCLWKSALSLILGGGINNYHERVTKGYVTDYVSFGVKNQKFKNIVFNISDFFIMIGAVLYVLSAVKDLFRRK